MSAESFPTNVLLLGKTGVGKSTLLNYIFDNPNQAKTGAGRPVTEADIIAHPTFSYKGMDIAIHDSWGLEPDKARQWRQIIENKVRLNGAKDIRDWFHTIIYCIDSKRSRIDDFEIDIINSLQIDGNRLVFALTRADIASKEEITAVETVLGERWNFPRVPVCSQARKLLSGTITRTFGREELLSEICRNLTDNLFGKALFSYLKQLAINLGIAEKAVLEDFEERAGYFGIFTIYGEEFKKDTEKAIKKYYTHGFEASKHHLEKLLETILKMEAIAHSVLGSEWQRKVYSALQHDGNYNLKKDNTGDLEWWEIPLIILAAPLLAIVATFAGKSWERDKTKENCSRISHEMLESQKKIVAQIIGESLADTEFTINKAVTTGLLPWSFSN